MSICYQSDPTLELMNLWGLLIQITFKIIDEIDEMHVRGLTIASRGEPLLCEDLDKILKHIQTKNNILELKINTNAKRLTEEKLKMLINSPINILIISTDHYKKEPYEEYRHDQIMKISFPTSQE